MKEKISIRDAAPADINAVLALDTVSPPEVKAEYWRGMFERYFNAERNDRFFLVAEKGEVTIGFIAGEIRAWEFGSPSSGWIFALSVSPSAREKGVGQRLFAEICRRMKDAGVDTVRTMAERDNMLMLSFFRSQEMRSGRYIELEKHLD